MGLQSKGDFSKALEMAAYINLYLEMALVTPTSAISKGDYGKALEMALTFKTS